MASTDDMANALRQTVQEWKKSKKDLAYAGGTEEHRQEFRDAFNQEHPLGVQAQSEVEHSRNTFLENIGLQFGQGARSAAAGLQTFGEATFGTTEAGLAARVLKQHERGMEAYTPPEMKEAQADAALVTKAWDTADTFVEKAGAAGLGFGAFASNLAFNPEGVAYLAAQSAANIAAPIVTGAVAGAVTTGPGAPLAAFAGAVGGGYMAEAGQDYLGRISEEVQKRGLEFTEENIQSVLDDPEFLKSAASKSRRKALTTAVVDAALTAGVARVVTKPLRTAQATAKAKLGVKATKRAIDIEARTILKASQKATKEAQSLLVRGTKGIGKKAAAVVAEGLGEAISEGAGQLAAEGKLKAGELVLEALGGVGAGPVTAPAGIAIHGTKAASTAAFKRALLKKTPEEVQLKEQAKAPTTYKYAEKVAEAVEAQNTGETLNPESEEFNPIMGTEAASKMNQKENVPLAKKVENMEQAEKAHQFYQDKKTELIKEGRTLAEGMQAEDISDADYKKADTRMKEITRETKGINTIMKRMEPHIDSMKLEDTDKATALEEINIAIASTEDTKTRDAVLSVLGSRQGASLAESKTMGELVKSTKDPAIKAMVQQVQEYQRAETALETAQGKTVSQVYTDVISGGRGKRGIKDYTQAIAMAVKSGDTEVAKSQLQGLQTFATRHTTKAGVFSRVLNATLSKRTASPADTKALATYSAERQAITGQPYTVSANSKRMINTMNLEADALTKAVSMMESLISPAKRAGQIQEDVVTVKKPEGIKESLASHNLTWESSLEDLETALPAVKDPTVVSEINELISFKKWQAKKLTTTTKEARDDTVPRKEPTTDRITEITKEKVLDKTRDPERVDGKPEVSPEDKVPEIERRQDVAGIVKAPRYVRHDLTTASDTDATNQIKNTFEPAKVKKGILNESTGDILQTLTPETISDILPERQNAEPVLKSLKAFGKQFRTAFEGQFLSQAPSATIVYKTLRNKIRTGFPKLIDGEEYKWTIIKVLEAFKGRDNITPTEIWKLLAKAGNPRGTVEVMKWVNDKVEEEAKDFRHTDPIQYLTDDTGKIHQRVVDALWATSFNWLATRAEETIRNEPEDIKRVLGVADTTVLPKEVVNLIYDKGVTRTMLQESLGMDAYKLLGIKPTKESGANTEKNMINSLGLQAITALESMGLLEHTQILSDTPPGKEGPLGIGGLISMITTKDMEGFPRLAQSFVIPKGTEITEGMGVTHFYRVATEGRKVKSSIKDRIINPSRDARDVWSALFEGEKQSKSYVWEKPTKVDKQMKRTAFDVSDEQAANLKKNSQMPWKASNRTMGFWKLLGEKNLRKILGELNPSLVHEINEDSARGVNMGIDRTLQSVEDWMIDAAQQENVYESEFYINQYFVRQGRMHQEGVITPQGNKAHRFLFNMKKWERVLDPTNPEHHLKFMEGIALGLDIETTKIGKDVIGKDVLTVTAAKAEAALNTEVMQQALASIHSLLDQFGEDSLDLDAMGNFAGQYEQEMSDIVAGVMEGGSKIHTLKVLVEYARYQKARADGRTEFSTDMPTEIDGVSNGIILARVQLMGAGTDQAANLAALQNGGFALSEDQPGLAEHLGRDLSYDAYKATGSAWSSNLLRVEESLLSDVTDAKDSFSKREGIKKLRQFKALSRLFGEFRDIETGAVSKAARTASKSPTMTTVYGMQDNSLKTELQESFLSDITSKIEKIMRISTEVDKTGKSRMPEAIVALDILNQDLKDILGKSIFPADVVVEGKINTEVLRTAYFSIDDINTVNKLIKDTHFAALSGAISEVYGALKAAFKTLNTGINLQAARYNTIRKIKLDILQGIVKEQGREVTIGEMDTLNESLKDMFPAVVTGSGAKIPLAKMSKAKSYGKNEVRQKYKNMDTKKAAPTKDAGVDMPGVGGTVVTNHNQDSLIANNVMGLFDMLNNHDGFTTSVMDAKDMGIAANKKCFEVLRDFDMGQAIHDSTMAVATEFSKHKTALKAAGVPYSQIEEVLLKELNVIQYGDSYTDMLEKGKVTSDNLADVIKQVHNESQETAKITKENKDILLDAVVRLEQYSYPGSAYVTGNVAKTIKLGGEEFIPTDITKHTEEALQKGIAADKALGEQVGEAVVSLITQSPSVAKPLEEKQAEFEQSVRENPDMLFSSQESISVDPADYRMKREVNKMNVLNVYDQIKGDSTIVDGADHDDHLRGILSSLVQKVMDPIDVFMKTNPDMEPTGAFTPMSSGKGRIFISHQSQAMGTVSGALHQGIRMSSGEVYTHEMLHPVLRAGLNKYPALRSKVEKLFHIAKKEMTPADFASDTTNPYEMAAAKERFDYIFNNTVTDIRGKNNYLNEFLTFSLSNKNMIDKTTGIALAGTEYNKSFWKGIAGKNIQETMVNIGQAIMDLIHKGFRSSMTESTMDKELAVLAQLLTRKDSERKSALYATLQSVGGKYAGLIGMGNTFVKSAVKKLPVIRMINELRDMSIKVKASNTIMGQWMREREYSYQQLDQGLVKSLIAEVRGRTDRLGPLYDLLNYRNRFLDAAKQAESEYWISKANDLFTGLKDKKGRPRKLTGTEKTAITKALINTDASVLISNLSMKRFAKVLQDTASLEKEVDAVLNQIKKDKDLAPHLTYYQRAADAMGHFMVHASQRSDEEAFQNAKVIVLNAKDADVMHESSLKRAETLVDQLGSLYAVQYTSQAHKDQLKALIDQDAQGVNGAVRMHEVLKDRALQSIFTGSETKFIKGYTKQILNSRISLKYGTLDDAKQFALQGYVRSANPIPRDPSDPMKGTAIYTYTSRVGRVNDYLSTILSYTANIAKGTASDRIAQEMALSTAEGQINNQEIIRKRQINLAKMADPNYTPKLRPGNYMVPQVDDTGTITQYRYMMAEVTKDTHMEQVTEFDTLMGAMAGQIVDKVRTPVVNTMLVQGLKAMYDDEYQHNPAAFVEIGPNSKDPNLREKYYMIPAKARKDIKRIWGEHKMMVSKDVVNLAFGYRHPSVVSSFAKAPADMRKTEKLMVDVFNMAFGKKAAIRAGSLESIAMQLAKYAKNNIIVKSAHVTIGNMGSNLIYLKMRGIPVSKIVTLASEAMTQGTKYQVDAKRLVHLQIKEEMLLKGPHTPQQIKELRGTIARVTDSLARNPTTRSIDAGLMPSLIDDIETVTSGHSFPTEFEKKVTAVAGKLPSLVQNMGKVAMLTEDTQAYKILNNAVKMTDFIGRHVLFTHYLDQGMNQKEATHRAIDEFINFSIPTHRMIEYANSIGLLRFTKYATRILKVIAESVVDRPLDVFMAYMLSVNTGMDNILNSIPLVTKGAFSNVGDPVSMFLDSIGEPVTITGIDSIFNR